MQKKKKGFTLVELLVVIAILAILAGVSVVGYLSFTKKAKESNDISLTKQLNTLLQPEQATSGKPQAMSDALNIVARNGFDVSKMTPTSEGYNYVWDKESNKFILLNDSWTAVTPTDINDANLNDTFGIAKNNEELTKLVEKGYGVYLSDSYNDVLPTMVNSIDTGSKGLDVTFETTKADNFIIRTNGGNLTINAANASVDHFGSANKTVITAVKEESYHEFGSTALIDITAGRVVAEGKSNIGGIYINNANVKVEIKTSASVEKLGAATGVDITINGQKVEVIDKENFESSTLFFAGGNGSKETPFLI